MRLLEDALLFLVAPAAGLMGMALVFYPGQRHLWSVEHVRRVARRHWLPIAIGFAVVGLDLVETRLDPEWTARLGWDFTPFFARIDGGLQSWLQRSLESSTPALHVVGQGVQLLLQLVYVVAFPFLLYLTPILYAWADNAIGVRRSIWAIGLCYAVAIPFYLLLPVNEVWKYTAAHPAAPRVENLVNFLPLVGEHLYDFDGVNNNVPSLHTALSCALAGVIWGSGPRRLRIPAAILAVLTVVSTIVLGIHWTLDVVAGLALAWLVVLLAKRFVPDATPILLATPPNATWDHAQTAQGGPQGPAHPTRPPGAPQTGPRIGHEAQAGPRIRHDGREAPVLAVRRPAREADD